MPLPLREPGDMPVVLRGSVLGAVELAAGSPVTDPRPLGAPADCAAALAIERTSTAVAIDRRKFIVSLPRRLPYACLVCVGLLPVFDIQVGFVALLFLRIALPGFVRLLVRRLLGLLPRIVF